MIEADLTPTFITFKDQRGREWTALALIAPLKSEFDERVHLGIAEDLGLKLTEFKIVRKGDGIPG